MKKLTKKQLKELQLKIHILRSGLKIQLRGVPYTLAGPTVVIGANDPHRDDVIETMSTRYTTN